MFACGILISIFGNFVRGFPYLSNAGFERPRLRVSREIFNPLRKLITVLEYHRWQLQRLLFAGVVHQQSRRSLRMSPHSHIPRPTSRRLPLVQPPYPDQLREAIGNPVFGDLSPINLRLALANQPEIAIAFQRLAHAVMFKAELAARYREVAIIRTGALHRSEYEWGMHVSIYGKACAITDDEVRELTLCTSWQDLKVQSWAAPERLIVRVCDELHGHATVSDATWEAMASTWPRSQIVELLVTSSFYGMAASFLNAAGVPLESGSRRFPPGISQAGVPAGEG